MLQIWWADDESVSWSAIETCKSEMWFEMLKPSGEPVNSAGGGDGLLWV